MTEGVSVQITCPGCLAGKSIFVRRVLKPYYAHHIGDGHFTLCDTYDSELRHIGEPLGFYQFAWKPVRCRNGLLRWLRTVRTAR